MRTIGKVLLILSWAVSPLLSPNAGVAQTRDEDGDGYRGEVSPQPPASGAPQRGAGLLLIDRSHGEDVEISPLIAEIQSQGWVVMEHLAGPITVAVLAPFDALMIPGPSGLGYPNHGPGITPFTVSEVAAIESFYASGRGVWCFSEYLQDPAGINSLSGEWGVTFNDDIIEDPDSVPLYWPQISNLVPHPITNGVGSYTYLAGCSLNAAPPSALLASADENAYSDFYPAGTFPPALASAHNNAGGCAVFQGDVTNIPSTLVANILECLSFGGPVSIEEASWGSVKAMYRSDR
jgi:hypothetical protein